MTITRNTRPNLSSAALRRRASRITFLLSLYALAQTFLLTELFRLY